MFSDYGTKECGERTLKDPRKGSIKSMGDKKVWERWNSQAQSTGNFHEIEASS